MCASDVLEAPAMPAVPHEPVDYTTGGMVTRLQCLINVLTEIIPRCAISVMVSANDSSPWLHIDTADFQRFVGDREFVEERSRDSIRRIFHWRGVDVLAIEFVPTEEPEETEP